MFEWIKNKPKFVHEDYKESYPTPCSKYKESGQTWYKGTGISAENHPLKGHIWFKGCGNCKSEDVEVIAAQWNVSFHSGDQYWDYEIFCKKCGMFTQRAFAEND